MIKKLFLIIIISASLNSLSAQFEINRHYAGPMIGLSFLGSAFQIGGGYEYAMNIENFGNVGIGGIIRYWSYSENAPVFGGSWSYSNFLIGAQGNYHFVIDERKFDPWAGLVLGFNAGSVDYDGPFFNNYAEPSHGGVWLGFQGGLRYWIQPNLALTSRVAFGTSGYGALDIGVDFKF
jgi:hypothetical protein